MKAIVPKLEIQEKLFRITIWSARLRVFNLELVTLSSSSLNLASQVATSDLVMVVPEASSVPWWLWQPPV